MLTHIYENYRSIPLAEETKEPLQSASLELLIWSSSQLLIEVVDNTIRAWSQEDS